VTPQNRPRLSLVQLSGKGFDVGSSHSSTAGGPSPLGNCYTTNTAAAPSTCRGICSGIRHPTPSKRQVILRNSSRPPFQFKSGRIMLVEAEEQHVFTRVKYGTSAGYHSSSPWIELVRSGGASRSVEWRWARSHRICLSVSGRRAIIRQQSSAHPEHSARDGCAQPSAPDQQRENGNAYAEQVGIALSASCVCQAGGSSTGGWMIREISAGAGLCHALTLGVSCAEPGALREPFPLTTNDLTGPPHIAIDGTDVETSGATLSARSQVITGW
jgi:hypothetical protein